jgi:methylase of polypeptide subunit release factors
LFWITVLLISLVIFAFFFFLLGSVAGAPWVPTPKGIVRKMLSMADVESGEVVYDLGSGDGRIIIMAAREFQANSVGIEINPISILWIKVKIALFRLSGKVNVVWGNFFNKDLSKANVVILYLLQGTNDKLKPNSKKN